MSTKFVGATVALVVSCVLMGCSTPEACVPGQTAACACLGGGGAGVQSCNDQGTGFNACTGCLSSSG
jgi:hypothetical protein